MTQNFHVHDLTQECMLVVNILDHMHATGRVESQIWKLYNMHS